MDILKTEHEPRIFCFHCDGSLFHLRDRQRIYENKNGKSKPRNNWQVLLECQSCSFSTTKTFKNYPFEDRLITYLRQQRIIGNKRPKRGEWGDGYWVQQWGKIPWDDKAKQYRPDKLKWFKRN